MALRLIQCSDALDLIGITSVFGNAPIDITTRNALHLAARFGINAPVARGASDPLVIRAVARADLRPRP